MASLPHGVLLKFLESMDATSVAPCLRSRADRQWLETDIWELQYRLDHVGYHAERLLQMMRNEPAVPEPDAASSLGMFDFSQPYPKALSVGYRNVGMSSQLSSVIWDPRLGYELTAFLSATRAALDVLARIAARFFKGYSSAYYSMSDIGKKLRDYEGDEQLLQIIRDHWNRWIEHLRDYRDELVHRTTIRTKRRKDSLSFKRGRLQKNFSVTFGNVKQTTHMPVVIPQNPKRNIITREHVIIHDEWYRNEGYIITERHGSVKLDDDTYFTIEMERNFESDPTHVPLDEFCYSLRQNLDDFTETLVGACQERLPLQAIVVSPCRK